MNRFCVTLLVLIIHLGLAQSPVDSLRKLIHESDDPKRKIDLENTLSYLLFDYSLQESFQTSREALRESQRINYGKGECAALINQGIYFLETGDLETAKVNNLQALRVGRSIKNYDLMAYAELQTGKIFRDKGYFDSAQQHYERALEFQRINHTVFRERQIYALLSELYLYKKQPLKAIEFGERALNLALALNNPERIAYSWLDLGNAHRDNYNFDKARECFAHALEAVDSSEWIVTEYHESLGNMQMLQGDLDPAFQSLTRFMEAYETYQGKHALARSLIKIGEILEEKGLFDAALEYLYKSLKLAEESGYEFLKADSYFEIGWVHYRLNQLTEAEISIRKAEIIFQRLNLPVYVASCLNASGLIQMNKKDFDSSLYFHQSSLKIRKEVNNPYGISSSLFNLGELYLEFNKPNEALASFSQGIKIDSANEDKYGVCLYKNRIGKIYLNRGNHPKAEFFLKQSLALSKEIKSLDMLGENYNDLATLFEKRGEYKQSIEYRKLYEINYDSIYNKGVAQSVASYRALYDLNSKDQQIDLLNKDKLLQAEKIQSQNYRIYGIGFLAFVLALVVYGFNHYFVRLKALNYQVQERNEEIQTQAEELQESNSSLMRLNTELNKQREEIQAQAEELLVSNDAVAKVNEGLEKMVQQRTHDLQSAYQELDTFFYRSSHDFRRPLTTLMGLAEVAKLSVKDSGALDLFGKVNATARSLDKMLVKLQSISDVGSHQLVFKEVLLKQIIDNAFEPFRDGLREKQASVTIDINFSKPCISYPALIKIAVENIIENAMVFGDPFKPVILVRAFREGLTVIVEVEDNGEGIHPEVKAHLFEMFYRGSERSSGNGLGLYIAHKAMEKIGGKISFKNNERRPGVTFKILIPDLQP